LNKPRTEISQMNPSLKRILEFLQRNKIRATYDAVGGCIGVPARSMGEELGHKCPLASWVVSKQTEKPTDYFEVECDPELYSNGEIITETEDLRTRMRVDAR